VDDDVVGCVPALPDCALVVPFCVLVVPAEDAGAAGVVEAVAFGAPCVPVVPVGVAAVPPAGVAVPLDATCIGCNLTSAIVPLN